VILPKLIAKPPVLTELLRRLERINRKRNELIEQVGLVGHTLHHLTKSLGYLRVADVGRLELARLRDEKLAAGLSKATVKLVLAYSSRMWNWARSEGLITVENPVALVDKPSVAGQAMDFNFLALDEADHLLSWSRGNQSTEYPAYATALYTGLRMGEMWGLRWADCDLDRGLLTVRRSYRMAPKSGRPRAVPINPALLPILRQWRNDCPASDEALAFPTARGYMRQKDHDYGFKDALTGAKCHHRFPRAPAHVREPLHDEWREHPDAAKAARPFVGGGDDEIRAPCAGFHEGRDRVVAIRATCCRRGGHGRAPG